MNNEITVGVRDFILGGNANFTIYQEPVNGKPAITIKYQVRRNKEGTCWFISTETINNGDTVRDGRNLVYQGYLKRDLTFNVGTKGMSDYNKTAINGLLWVLHHHNNLPKVVHVFHHGICSACGRRLTDVESLRCGLGPVCRKKRMKNK